MAEDTEYDTDFLLGELDAEDEEEASHAAEVEEAEKKADDAEDSKPKKSRVEERVEALEKKYEQDVLQTAIKGFKEHADEDEIALFEAARKDDAIKNLSDFQERVSVAKREAANVREAKEKLMKEAEEQAAQAWGTGPVGRTSAPADAEKELMERINAGDTRALAEALATDLPF
jgi:hypothetical protein